MRSESGAIVRHVSKWVLLSSLVLAALLSVAGRVLVANAEYFKSAIEDELADYGITGVSLENISGSWSGLHPVLNIHGASLSIPGRSQALSIDQLAVTVKLFSSLVENNLKLESLHASVTKLILDKDRDGHWWLNNIPLSQSDGGSGADIDIYRFFSRLPDFVNIEIKLIQIRDQLNSMDHLVQQTRLRGSRRAEKLNLSLNANLPATLGYRVELLLTGDQNDQVLYLEAPHLDLVNLLQLAGYKPEPVTHAQVTVKSWARLQRFKPIEFTNDAVLYSLVVGEREDRRRSLSARVRQLLRQEQTHWRVDTSFSELNYAGRRLDGINAQILIAANQGTPTLWLDRIDLAQWRPFLTDLAVDESIRAYLTEARPQAELSNIMARLDPISPLQSRIGFEFNQLRSDPHAGMPGVDSLSGSVTVDQGSIQVDIDETPLRVSFAKLFRDPLVFDRVSSRVDVSATGSGWIVSAPSFELENSDISLRGRLWLEKQPEQPGFLSLRADYRDGRIAATGRYLPVGIMAPVTVAWLDRSLQAGQIPRGDLLFHGRLRRFSALEAEQSGVFHALFDVEDPLVDYLPDWPAARGGGGSASFHNNAMHLQFADVGFGPASLEHVEVGIANFRAAELAIKGSDTSDTGTLVSTLAELPVLKFFEDIRARSRHLQGQVKSEIAIELPLQRERRKDWSLRADGQLEDVAISIPEWMVDLSAVNGRMQVRDHQVSARGLQARYAGRRARLDVKSGPHTDRTEFHLHGMLASQPLARLLPDYLRQPVSGVSDWDIQVTVPHHPSVSGSRMSVKATSQLDGSALAFPAPFGLGREQAEAFYFEGQLGVEPAFDFELGLGKRVQVSGRMLDLDTTSRLAFLQAVFGEESRAVEREGYFLQGRIDELDMDEWFNYADRYFDDNSDSASLYEAVEAIELVVDRLWWGSQQVDEVKLDLRNTGTALAGNVDSNQIRGRLQLPYHIDRDHPLLADLDYLRLTPSKREREYKPAIEEMPNLNITSREFDFDSMRFNDLKLRSSNAANRFDIEQLDFERDQVELTSSGHWQYDSGNDEHVTVFNIKVNGEEFGKTVQSLGLGNSIRRGDIDFEGQVGWGGSLYDINWPTLIGEVSLSLKNGYLNNIEPGAGRFVGLLSLSALPKRLFFDFGDVLSEGMQFDEISGDFKIQGEVMTTDNARMEGASAHVKISGDTNLREKTYDQTMIIVPQIGDTLPVLGSIAAGNAVGWGLLLIQRIFKKPIDKSMEIKYHISGTWSDPDIELISKPEAQDFFDDSDILNENP